MSVDITPGLNTKYTLRGINSPEEFVKPVIAKLRNKGIKNIAIIKTEDPFLGSCADAFKANLSADEKVTILANVDPGELDFKTYVSKLVNANYEAIGIYLYPGRVNNFYRHMEAFRINAVTFGTDIFESIAEVKAAGPAMNGAIYPTLDTPQWFVEEYKKIYTDDSQLPYGYNGYAVAVITAKLLSQQTTKPSAEQIINLYKTAKPVDTGVSYEYKETTTGDKYLSFPLVIKKVANERFVIEP